MIGNKCDQFVGTDHYPNLCEAAGIKNFHNAIGDNNDGQSTQCMALKEGGCRCTRSKIVGVGSDLCTQHHNKMVDGNPPAMAESATSNPQEQLIRTGHLDDMLELAWWRVEKLLPIIKAKYRLLLR